ncbi:MAG: hypothetical protein ACREDT_14915 [Methylocella sp.]
MVTLLRAIVVLLCICFFAGLGYVIYIDIHFWSSLPPSTDEAGGRVHEIIVMHGSIRFGTEAEVETLHFARKSGLISGIFGFAAVIINAVYKVFPGMKIG